MNKKSYPYYLANQAVYANQNLAVYDKYSHDEIARVAMASPDIFEQAIESACEADGFMRKMPCHARKAILEHCSVRFNSCRDDLVEVVCAEAGKPRRDAEVEVQRLIETFNIAAEECSRLGGETLAMDICPRTEAYTGMTKRVPIGPCAFISPFNFPLNLVAHKVAPAIAVGCPFVLKPASLTPLSALMMGEILAETDLPKGAFSILPATRSNADMLTEDDRFKLLSFTGSPDVGWDLKARAGKKKVTLELGGNAACIVDETWNLDDAVARILIGAYAFSGQTCISVQRIYAQASIYEALKEKLLEGIKGLQLGAPQQASTQLGPMISVSQSERLEQWIAQARDLGAMVLAGGQRDAAMMPPHLLEQVPEDCSLYADEAFGPVALLEPYDKFEDALDKVNASRFGLQAGVFTRDIYRAHQAWNALEVGGVVIGDVPSWRVDHMPYGGVKDSGLGREGLRWAMEDMSELRLMVLRSP